MITKTTKTTDHTLKGLLALALLMSVLLVVSGARPAEAASPGTNGRIAFHSTRDGDFEVFTTKPGGTGVRQLTNNKVFDVEPAYSADGKKIVFSSTRDGNQEIYSMNADGSGVKRLTNNPTLDAGPVFAPNGEVLFATSRDGNFEVYSMNPNGSSPTNLTKNPGNDFQPTVSPDGTKVVFMSERDGNSEIYSMNSDGSGQTRLTSNTSSDDLPDFSPNGRSIAFQSNRDGNLEVYTMNTDGSGQTRLTFNGAEDRDPAFSPDGTRISFTSTRDGNPEVYTMTAQGTSQTNVSKNPASDSGPSWQPLPTTFTITSIQDSADLNVGDDKCDAGTIFGLTQCTLRAAIQEANANPGPDVIKFDIIGDGVHTIVVGSSGQGELPAISEQVTIDGYTQTGASPNTMQKGTNAVLRVELDESGPGGDGLRVNASANNSVIRGLVINRSRFQNGIFVAGDGSRIEGNFIGTDPSGTQDLGNNRNGVQILGASNVTVGGTTPAARNLISGNQDRGVEITATQARNGSSNRVLGNLIGTDRTGTKDLGNVIGVTISAPTNSVGDGSSAGANTIAFNGGGVHVASDGNRILRNSIFSNDGLGIDLLTDGFSGVTPNDPGDKDLGPNRQQNFPVLDSAKAVSGKTTITGQLDSARSEAFVIRFYSNPPDTNEGKTFIGQKKITTSVDGLRSFTFQPKNSVALNRTITATATRNSTGDTSEFSAGRTVAAK